MFSLTVQCLHSDQPHISVLNSCVYYIVQHKTTIKRLTCAIALAICSIQSNRKIFILIFIILIILSTMCIMLV